MLLFLSSFFYLKEYFLQAVARGMIHPRPEGIEGFSCDDFHKKVEEREAKEIFTLVAPRE